MRRPQLLSRPAKLALLALALAALHPAARAQVEENLPGAGFGTPDAATPTIHVYSRETVIMFYKDAAAAGFTL